MLPVPPNDQEKYLYVRPNKLKLYIPGIFSFVCLLIGMSLFVLLHSSSFFLYGFFVILIGFYLGLSYFIGVFGDSFDFEEHKKIISQKYEPSIDIYLPSCGESRDIIENTLRHVAKLDYPYFKVFVMDDSKNFEHNSWLKDLSDSLGFNYVSRPNKGELKKAGNIRYTFAKTDGDFFLILDADFAPRPDMLKEMIPYMLDSKVAIVQSPQYFSIKKEQTDIEKGAAYIQELFYRLIQVNRKRWNAAICVGTCALYRRSALEPHGGTAAIGYSEDVHTGFQAICDGYKIKYIPINLSKGVCPDKVMSFLVQQYRWATGSITLFLNPHFWKADLSIMVKLNYLSGMLYYITTGVGLYLIPIPGLAMLIFYPEGIFFYNLLFSIPSLIYGTIGIALWSKAKWGMYGIYVRQLSYWAHLFALIDKLRDSTIAWIPTGNVGSSANGIKKRFFTQFVVLNSFVLAVTLGMSFFRMFEYPYYHFIPNILLCVFNIFIFVKSYSVFTKNLE